MSNKQLPAEVQLPVEVVEQIKTNAALRAYHDEGKDNRSFSNGYYSGYVSGATAYATKLHQVQKENEELKRQNEKLLADLKLACQLGRNFNRKTI